MEPIASPAHARTLTQVDYVALTRLLAETPPSPSGGEDAQRALEESRLVPSHPVAPGVVTMNAQVFLVAGPQEQFCRVTLCYPDEADPARGRISVLSPLGGSLLGRHAGQTVTWRSFGRVQAARIVSVLAPLRAPAPRHAD
jgi:regulator of nucleoside diphosphate kinase